MARLALMFNILEEAHRLDMADQRYIRRKNRYNSTALAMNDEDFLRTYRLTKDLFQTLVSDLSPYLKKPKRKSDISVQCKILIALSFYGSGCNQKHVSSNVRVMSQQSTSIAIREVTKALNTKEVFDKYIKFPNSEKERSVVKQKFYEKFQMQDVIGCIDTTHVAIIRPAENEDNYLNRKRFHSTKVQIICDSEMNILSVDAHHGGATRKAFIFNHHPVKQNLLNLMNDEETTFLLGDSGYHQSKILMTPIAKPKSDDEYYNKKHRLVLSTVQQTIGILKTRWRCLLGQRVLHNRPQYVAEIINACCVLHNLCNSSNCAAPDVIYEDEHGTDVSCDDENQSSTALSDELRVGIVARQHLVRTMVRSRQAR